MSTAASTGSSVMVDRAYQASAVREVIDRIDAGVSRLCVTAPTGAGKTLIMQRLLEHYGSGVVYCNRRLLIDQTCKRFDDAGLDVSILAAGYAQEITPYTIASIRTVCRRKIPVDRVPIALFDELHSEKGVESRKLMEEHIGAGGACVGFTATPIGLGGLVDELVVACNNSEARNQGALVPATTYAPDEPDMKAFKSKERLGLLQFEERYEQLMLDRIFGSVAEHYQKLNPMGEPTILFGPGVEQSKWFSKMLNSRGIVSAHIDGQRIVRPDGTTEPTDSEARNRLFEDLMSGRIKVLCNRFVLREGLDLPGVGCGILACSFGSLASYLQAGGRLLRKAPGKEEAVIQDHGGNWWRHSSLNSDRLWHLDDDEATIKARTKELYQTKKAPEPFTCPKCKKVRSAGLACPACGFTATGKVRTVIQVDGTLKQVRGDIYKQPKVNEAPDAHKKWTACVFRSKHANRTFNQARALFLRETGGVPDESFPCYPKHNSDWQRVVGKVPWRRLTPYKK